MMKKREKKLPSQTRLPLRALFLVGLLSFVVPASTSFSAPLDFCEALKEIIASGQKKFKSIRGKLDLVSEEHFGTLIPPGMKDCFGWRDGKAYHCSSDAGLNPMEVGQRYDDFKRAIEQCLGDQWASTETQVNRVSARRFVSYVSSEEKVSLRMSERNKRQGWYVDFYFRR